MGQQGHTIRSQADTGTVPFQKGDLPIFFQILNHPADPGLRVGEDLGCLGQAASLHSFDQSPVFLKIHVHGVILYI